MLRAGMAVRLRAPVNSTLGPTKSHTGTEHQSGATLMDLDSVVERLNKHRQRATYGAVAALVGGSPRSLMSGRNKCSADSWVVAKANGLPSGYHASEAHPDLKRSSTVISDADQLRHWLQAHP